MNKLFIPILLGTVRQGRQSGKVANWVLKKVEEHDDIETQLFDPGQMELPMDGEDGDYKEANQDWKDAIMRADGLITIVPEYNHSFPGSMKRALDLLLPEYNHKALGVVGVSAGVFGGARAIEHLIPVARELGLVMTGVDLHFPQVQNMFNDDGTLKDEASQTRRFDRFMTELIWMAKTLKWGRDNLT